MIQLKQLMNEGTSGKYVVEFRNVLPGGKDASVKVTFAVHAYSDRIVFMEANSKELDKLMKLPIYKYSEDVAVLIANHVSKKNKMNFIVDTSYPGAGYAIKIDLNDIVKGLK